MGDEYDETIPEEGPGFHLFAKFGLAIESMAAELRKASDREQRRLMALPINYPLNRLSNLAVATDVLDFNGPQPGRIWHVRLLTAYATPVGANATTISWYVGQIMPGDAVGQLPVNMKRWEFTSLPGDDDFSPGVIVVRNGEKLIAGLTGIPASSRISVTAVIADEPEWAARFAVTSE